jgi:hypothetical protein
MTAESEAVRNRGLAANIRLTGDGATLYAALAIGFRSCLWKPPQGSIGKETGETPVFSTRLMLLGVGFIADLNDPFLQICKEQCIQAATCVMTLRPAYMTHSLTSYSIVF